MFQRPAPQTKQTPTAPEVIEARFRRFLRDLETYERHISFERTVDAFLDVYSQWRKTRQEGLKLRLVLLAFELHRLDSHFECDLTFQDQAA